MTIEPMDESYERLWEIIKDSPVAMLITVEEDGSIRSRPMTTVQKEFSGRLWFFAPTMSDAVRAIEDNASVCVAYANTADTDFVSISGHASIVHDAAIKQKLWSPMVQTFFPDGAEASSVSLIKVYADHAEYWDSDSNKVVQLFSMASAYLNGTTPKHMGEHRKMKFD